ncbi:MAG: single-stranded-DNA-specific exonuclease RecJ, partial [Candidatus Shapirobacteria bacterium]|nr:single-stranded-DNA-specific exonuclease RecJ [Candidatus Shapirobacteria bacterium]
MKWKILSKNNIDYKEKEIIKILLSNRGLKTKKEIDEFLNPKKPEELTPKEVGLDAAQIKKATQRIKKAIKEGEKIIVYGDYDTDGICGTAILWESLHHLGANVLPFIPLREEGYGLKVERIEKLAQEGVKLIITVDQGIVAYQQVEHAQKLGIDVIITDHHVLGGKKQKALAIVHTTQLSGAGVAWFLANKSQSGLDLVTLATIADMVPLVGPNRSLVKYGLKQLRQTKRPGLLALFDFAGFKKENLGVFEISYLISPRLNAAGRLDDSMESLRLVCTQDEKRAIALAQKINQQNRERQNLTEKTMIHARELWLREDSQSDLIFVVHESYQEGIIGLVAGKLTEEFYRPAIVVSKGKEFSRGSARSIKEFNILEAIRACADMIGSHGGHQKAAAFIVETAKIEILKEKLTALTKEGLKDKELSPTLNIDMELDFKDLTFDFYKELAKLEPFGESNPQPIFVSHHLKVVDAKTVGATNKHLKLRLASPVSRLTFNAIGFGMG